MSNWNPRFGGLAWSSRNMWMVSVSLLMLCGLAYPCFGDSALAPATTELTQAPLAGAVVDAGAATAQPGMPARPPAPGQPAGRPGSQSYPAALIEELFWLAVAAEVDSGERVEEIFQHLENAGHSALRAITDSLLDTARVVTTAEQDLRQALLALLLGSADAEVDKLALELLARQPHAAEVAQLGVYLGSRHPGRFTMLIRNAAVQALTESDLSAEIPGALFHLLGTTGDSTTLALLLDLPMHRDAYASVALALLMDGSGVPLLENDARSYIQGQRTVRGRLAIELLAQIAHQQPEASGILVDLASKNLIPPDVWPRVVALVTGEMAITLVPPPGDRAAWYTIYRPEGNQTLYLDTRPGGRETAAQVDQRLHVLRLLEEFAPPVFMHDVITALD